MKSNSARTTLMQLLAGVHPVTGEILPEDCVVSEPLVQQALLSAVEALPLDPVDVGSTWQRKSGKLHAGRPWTEADNQELLQLAARGMALDDIARLMSRRVRGISNQLTLLQQAEDRPKKAGHVWSEEDDAQHVQGGLPDPAYGKGAGKVGICDCLPVGKTEAGA